MSEILSSVLLLIIGLVAGLFLFSLLFWLVTIEYRLRKLSIRKIAEEVLKVKLPLSSLSSETKEKLNEMVKEASASTTEDAQKDEHSYIG